MENAALLDRLKQKMDSYKPSAETISLVRATPKLFLVGISGAGKDTMLRELLKDGNYRLIISHTTRQPRSNNGVMEQDGREYHFINFSQAEHMLDTGAYIEAKMYGTNIYGTSAYEMQTAHDSSQVAVTDIEVQGVAEYMDMDPRTKVIFVLPPSYDVWHERFTRRYGDAPDRAVMKERMQAALREIEHALSVPYYHFLVNDSLPEAVAEAKTIAEGSEAPQQATHAHEIARELVARLKTELAGQDRQAAVKPKAQQR